MTWKAPPNIHRYPTQLKSSIAANVLQLEQQQAQQHSPFTMLFLTYIVNLTNKLKHKDLIKKPDADKWKYGFCNEIVRLAQGYTDTNSRKKFLHTQSDVPKGKQVTCARLVCSIPSQKTETRRFRIAAEGNLINYPGTTSTPSAWLTTIKIH